MFYGPYRVTATILKGVSIRFSKHLDQLETRPNKRGTVFARGSWGESLLDLISRESKPKMASDRFY
jgi:hypothetical protein